MDNGEGMDMTLNASANDVSTIITALESPALARLADATADDFVKTAETKDAYGGRDSGKHVD